MIITQKKPVEEIMAMVGDAKTVAIVGCNSCATACQTGGEPQIQEQSAILEQAGKKVVATTIADYCCMNLGVKAKMKPINAANPDCVICMSCGDGVQCVAKNASCFALPKNSIVFCTATVCSGRILKFALRFSSEQIPSRTSKIADCTSRKEQRHHSFLSSP